jgi:hypothetical protein
MEEVRLAVERGDRQAADESLARLIELEQERDARPGDFADDCCGDHTMTPVPGLLC